MRALPRWAAASAVVALLALTAACTSQDEGPTSSADPGAGRVLSEQDRADLAAALDHAAQAYGITDPPEVEMVSVVSAANWAATQVRCLRDAGYTDAVVGPDGGVAIEVPGEQQEAYVLASYTCQAKYPSDPAQDRSRMTREQKIVEYEYLTVTLVDCLAEHGYTITDLPSQETFLATWDTASWNPYTQLDGAPGGGLSGEELQTACPMNAPPELLWGD